MNSGTSAKDSKCPARPRTQTGTIFSFFFFLEVTCFPQGTARIAGRYGLRGGGQAMCGNQQLLQEQHLFLVFFPVPNKPRAAGSLWVNAEWSGDRKSGSLGNDFQPLQKGEARRGIFFGTVSLWQALVLSPKECSCVSVCVYNSCPRLAFFPTFFVRFDCSAGSAPHRWCPMCLWGRRGRTLEQHRLG